MKRAALAAFALLLLLSPLVLHARTTTTFGQNAVGAACNNIEKATDFDAIAQCNAGTGAVTDRPNGAGDDRVNGARRTW